MNYTSKNQKLNYSRKTMNYIKKKTHYIEENQSYKTGEKFKEKEYIFLESKIIRLPTPPSKEKTMPLLKPIKPAVPPRPRKKERK